MMVRGELAAAAEALEESHRIVQHPPPSRWMTWRYTTQCYAGLAQLALLQGDLDRARRLADQSLEIAVPTRSRKFESWARRIKGESAALVMPGPRPRRHCDEPCGLPKQAARRDRPGWAMSRSVD